MSRDRRAAALAKYGLTEDQYLTLLNRQGGGCAICHRAPRTRRLHVEHDHKTGRVRGLTCHFCNRQIIARNTVETAKLLVAYLESDFDGRTV